jgi:cellulose synthase/poly-beta-1,6-N-acetylglucosamine synthase-like glycosyltransferase
VTVAAVLLFWFGFLGIAAVWLVYPAALWLLARHVSASPVPTGGAAGTVTVLVAAHNEASNIAARLENISEQIIGKPLSILVALDHCTDDTKRILENWKAEHQDQQIAWFETTQRGKAMAHNEAMGAINTDLVVFTDADTIFESGFLDHICSAFDDPRVGYCSGVLSWRGKNTPEGLSHFPIYWRFETWLRIMESRLGICAVGTGACSAMRRQLFVPLHPTSDSDCSTPLDVIGQGYLCRIVPDAHAIDFVADTVRSEFSARVRMTSKNFINTIASWGWREGMIKQPSVTAGLILHKIGRWLTPYFALSLFSGGTIVMYFDGASFAAGVTVAGYSALAAAAAGFLWPSLPVLGALGSFAMANVAFGVGVFIALSGKVPASFGKS